MIIQNGNPLSEEVTELKYKPVKKEEDEETKKIAKEV